MKKKTFHIASLGCAKNTVDSDSMTQLLMQAKFQPTDDVNEAGVVIVNTCGFIGPAKEESLTLLQELAKQKKDGQYLIAAGCLTQRYGLQVAQQVPGLDGILGTRRWMDIVEVVQNLRAGQHPKPIYHLPEAADVGRDDAGTNRVSVQGASAYIKVADGCRRPCAFCAIPLIKGTAVSRPIDAILDDARILEQMGTREIILIAQDTTDYGHDLGMKNGLASLLNHLVVAAPGIDWFRVMYAYPGYVTDELIETMATHPQVLPYFTLEKMRKAIPGLALRTTFIVGYPGETEEEFSALMDFVESTRFDRVGTFQFSFEEGTASEPLGDPIPEEVKNERLARLMSAQQQISMERNQAWVGKTLDVLIEGQGDGISLGRSYRDAPEIDGMIVIEEELPIGDMLPIRITGAMTYDLTGIVDLSKTSQ